MSESEVSQIQDEDVLRRMWQATEDFGRKKEIRAHMYRLREERLRTLYSPEPDRGGKGCEFTGARGHGQSFADQSFQSMKSKEVRDAGSPPKEFSYRGQDLKELSNAGWNVESEDRTTDGGRTHVKFVNANIEGQYDVEGGRGHFAAVDQQRRAVTESQDEHSRSRRDETSASTAAHDHVVRRNDDGTHVSSTSSSSNTSSQVRQVSSTTHDAPSLERFDRRTVEDANTSERVTRITNTDDYERSLRTTNTTQAELVSRKVDYPDDNTKVIVETRVLPDGTRVTSTRREFRVPAHVNRAEHHARSETNSSHRSERRDTSSDTTRCTTKQLAHDIVDSQRNVDDYDFKKQLREYTSNERDEFTDTQKRHVVKTNNDHTKTNDEYTEKRYETRINNKIVDQSRTSRDDHAHMERHTVDRQIDNKVNEKDRHHTTKTQDQDVQRKFVKETQHVHDTEENVIKTFRERKENEGIVRNVISGTTVVTDGDCIIPRDTVPRDKTVPFEKTHKLLQNETENVEDVPREARNPQFRSQNVPSDLKTTENLQHINKYAQEEVIEKSIRSEHYQTTYQNDYQSRKVSTDWSPTHQAWASTLRADTPSNTRPSTRASSPGSRTFKSSTSSLRSSVSPDKAYRKPSSRGGSPNKVDRFSPTRTVTSDRYSSTHSTQTVTEEKVSKNTSPDRKPPNGRSPASPGYSPDRKLQDNYRERPSVSPEKRPKNFSDRTELSPERRRKDGSPRIPSPTRKNEVTKSSTRPTYSPERQPTTFDDKLNNSSYRQPMSPERKNFDGLPRNSPQRSTLSPDRKPGFQKPITPDTSTKRPSVSPDRKPNYMKPTVSSQADNLTQKPSNEPDREFSTKNSDHKSQDFNKTTKLIEDHYKFVDEETKEYTHTMTHTSKAEDIHSRQRSPTRKPDSPNEHSTHHRKTCQPREAIVKDKSPTKDKTTSAESDELYGKVETIDSVTTINQSDGITRKHDVDNKKLTVEKDHTNSEESPSKYDTYNKTKSHEAINTNVTIFTAENAKDKYDSMNRKDISLKKKQYNPTSPSKKNPRDSVSPTKSPTRDTRYKNTTDFISSEITSEETNKRNSTKERPRQLVTPSSSPTRKPKPTNTEPSTGQSSPTTSVSGFVYFGSPSTEKPIVTDLDEFCPESENPDATSQIPETLNVKRSPSPSKIPCRSPSLEKQVPSTKDSLPRKSSLKKPSTEFNLASPVEKPPTSFRVSPTNDRPDILDHKVMKKDQPSEPETGEPILNETKPEKQKPPLQRRETYDDRCKKILGLVDDTATENDTKEIRKYTRRPDNQTSPSISPCDSPAPNARSPFSDYSKPKTTKIDVTDFKSHERNDLTKTTSIRDEQKTKISSRDSSPTKLKDIMNTTTAIDIDRNKEEGNDLKNTTKYSGKSPTKDIPDDLKSKRVSGSPDRKKKSLQKSDQSSDKNICLSRESPDKVHGYSSTTETSTFDESSVRYAVDDVKETIKSIKKTQPTRVLKSPTRESPKDLPEHIESPRDPSPSKKLSNYTSPVRKSSPERKVLYNLPKDHLNPNCTDEKNQTLQRQSPEKNTGDMKSTTAVISELDHIHTIDITTDVIREPVPVQNKEPKSSSPTQKTLRLTSPSKSTSISESPSQRPDTSPQRKPTTINENAVPGYMKTTKTAVSKFDHTSYNTEEVQETKESTVQKTRTSSVSPTRKPILPKSPAERRTPSPSKRSRPSDISIDKRPSKFQPSSPTKESSIRGSEDKYVPSSSPLQPSPDEIPGYMKSTASIALKHSITEHNNSKTEDIQEKITSTITETNRIRGSVSPSRHIPKTIEKASNEHPRSTSPNKPSFVLSDTLREISPSRKLAKENKPIEKHLKNFSPAKEENTTEMNSTFENKYIEEKTSPEYSPPKIHENNQQRTLSPSKITEKKAKTSTSSPERKPSLKSPLKESPLSENKHPKQSHGGPRSSPGIPSYMNPTASITSKFETTSSTQETHETLFTNILEPKSPSIQTPTSRQSPEREPKDTRHLARPEESRQLRTPSPIKKATRTETNTDFIVSEREQEILNKVQKSLRKLSPERKEKSPSREKSPTKSTTSLQDLDIKSSETTEFEKTMDNSLTEIIEEQSITSSKVPRPTGPTQLKGYKPDNQKPAIKTSSRNVSPLKRTPSTPTSPKTEKSPESPTKSRSFSPKKPVERPQSPQQPKVSGIRHIPSVLTRKPTPATLSTSRIERITTDVKKTNGVSKQTLSKTTTRSIPSPTEADTQPMPTHKSVKDNVSPKKSTVSRTTSDLSLKPKKTSSPQRIKSKPEIQVNDISTKSPKYQKPIIREPHSKLPTKPKSATSLNTSIDEDDIIIDVQQSKSSRENSPDRICPTPINFADDVGIPRFPDEVSEPDDELVKRTHHTIHEAESVVDDIVEICEDEELFVKKSGMEFITEQDDSLLSVNHKVSKFTNKIQPVNKPKSTKPTDHEIRDHLENMDENLKSDECLLTVSEKVNKFAKGPKDTKDSRSSSRRITDEYDRDTVYTDDYTKLSVNDKAHLFVETAENIKTTKVKPAQKIERPDLSNVDESLKSDDCLLSVSDKVTKFVKSAEQHFTEVHEIEEKETHSSEMHDEEETYDKKDTIYSKETQNVRDRQNPAVITPLVKETNATQQNLKDYSKPSTKHTERVPVAKITTLRSSEAVKKAKALFETIASTQKITQKETTHTTKSTRLTDIGVTKKSPKTDSTTVLHPSVENVSPQVLDVDIDTEFVPQTERLSSGTAGKPQYAHIDEKPRSSPNRLTAQSPEVPRSKSPMRQNAEVTNKTILSRYPAATRAESPRNRPESPRPRTKSQRQRTDSDKPEKAPGYLRPTKTSQMKEETKVVEEAEVSSRRGSGKFGVELRRTSVERSTVSSERRRSVEHHQPCIEDIFDLDLLEQMLEKVSGYEQRRRIRAQIRVVKNQSEHVNEYHTHTKTTKHITSVPKTRSPERNVTKSPERAPKATTQRTASPDCVNKSMPQKTIPDRALLKEAAVNGHSKEPARRQTPARPRPQSPEKPVSKSTLAPKTPVRQPSPDKRRPTSPSKAVSKPKGNRFNEYASAYMKKVGLNDTDKIKFDDSKTKKISDVKQSIKHETQQRTVQEFTTTRSFTERTSSKDVIEMVQTNGKRSATPEQRQSPERKVHKTQVPEHKTQVPERRRHSPERRPYIPDHKAPSPDRKVHSPVRQAQSPDRLHQRTPSSDFKRPKAETVKETSIKTVYDIEKKIPSKPVQEEKPSWVTNRNLKKITSESRTFSSKKIESEKVKYRAPSPSKVIAKPTDVITSSYGPGPLDADGKPLFGIKALRNGATNFQVKGTVIRQEFHSRNGSAPEGSVSVTAYSSQPEELEALLAVQGAEPASRLHGLAAITTTKRFGPDTGHTLQDVHTKEERASLEQFTHHDRRVEHLERAHELSTQDSSQTTIEEITDTRTDQDRRENDRNTKREDKLSEVKRQKVEERREKMEKREDKKTVRQSSVKSLTEKYIKSANDAGKLERAAYPKAGLILRTTTLRDSLSNDDAHPARSQRADSEHSMCSVEEGAVSSTTERTGTCTVTSTRTVTSAPQAAHTSTRTTVVTHEPVLSSTRSTHTSHEPVVSTTRSTPIEPAMTRVTTTTRASERSFLDSSTKVSGVQDILTRMKNADIVIQEGDSAEDSEARALLNKFLGATVLMAGMQGYVTEQPGGNLHVTHHQEVRSSSEQSGTHSHSHSHSHSRGEHELDLDQCWDERLLNKLLNECTDYEQRRLLRARIRTLMAEQEACASAVTAALGAGGEGDVEAREEEEVTVTSSVRRDSSDKTVSSTTTTRTSKVSGMSQPAPKPVSPFAKFRQLEKQNSTNSPNSPKSPQSPGSPAPYFKFTDPALQSSALTIKERLLQWCRDKTRDYENVKLENFSTSWADGLAFCALVHHFLPDAFDYSKLTPDRRRHNFTLAFKVADEKAGIYPLLDVDDMVAMRKPDWKCVFTYVQAIYRRFKDEQ